MSSRRYKALRRALKAQGVDALLIINIEHSGQPNTRYVSGFSGSHSYTIVTNKQLSIITDGRYFTQVAKESPDFTLVKLGSAPLFELIKAQLRVAQVKSVLIDSEQTSYEMMRTIQKGLKGVRIVPHSGLLHQLRIVKDKEELACLAQAADISCRAFKKLLAEIKLGLTERFIAQRLEFILRELGADAIAFDTIVASGVNGAKPHARPTDKKIRKGELVTIDFGASYRGYMADMTRTIAIGKPSAKLAEIYEIVREAQGRGCAALRAGATGKEIDIICRSYIESQGYGTYFLHSTGHGLGMDVHELPYVSQGSLKPLPAGSVVTCEPGIYIEGVGGVRIEDALVVTKNGNINLNKKASKELLIV